MPLFHALPDHVRTTLRAAIEAAGGEVVGYCGAYMQVALPRPAETFLAAMEAAGLELDEHSLHYFPLGSDQPEARLRHQEGYWLYGNFSPRP